MGVNDVPASTAVKEPTQEYTLNKKKTLNRQDKSMVTVLQKKFVIQWRNFHYFAVTIFNLMHLREKKKRFSVLLGHSKKIGVCGMD